MSNSHDRQSRFSLSHLGEAGRRGDGSGRDYRETPAERSQVRLRRTMMQILQRTRDPFVLWTAVTLLISSTGLAQVPEGAPVVSNAAQAKFAKFPSLPDCFTGAVEHGDPSQGPSVILIKGSAGCAVPWHWHTPNEQVMMVSGTARVQAQDGQPTSLRPGAYFFMPSHHVHRFKCMTACLGFVHSLCPRPCRRRPCRRHRAFPGRDSEKRSCRSWETWLVSSMLAGGPL